MNSQDSDKQEQDAIYKARKDAIYAAFRAQNKYDLVVRKLDEDIEQEDILAQLKTQ